MRRFTVTVLAATTGLTGLAAVAAVGHVSATTPPSGTTAPGPAPATLLRPVLSCIEMGEDTTAVTLPSGTNLTLPDLTGFTLPDLTGFTLPDFSKFTLPDFSKFTIPGLTDLTLPDLTGFTLPDFSELSLPDFSGVTLPDLTGVSFPELTGEEPVDPAATQSQPIMPTGKVSGGACVVGPTTLIDPFEADAQAIFDPAGTWAIAVTIKAASVDAVNQLFATCFAGDATCPSKQVAIEVGGMIVSHPTVSSPTVPGQLQISGAYTEAEARALAAQINGEPVPPTMETTPSASVTTSS